MTTTMTCLLANKELDYDLNKSSNIGTSMSEVEMLEQLELQSNDNRKMPEIVTREMSRVKVKVMDKKVELKTICGGNRKATIRRLGNNKYLVIRTGEIKELKKRATRGETPQSVRDSNRKIADLIRMNYTAGKTLFITLTPKVKTTEPKLMTKLHKAFWREMKKCYKSKLSTMEYLYVLDWGENGGLDIHALWFFSQKVDIPKVKEIISKFWGYHKVQPAKSPYSAQRYFASHPIAKPRNEADKRINDKVKRFLNSPAGLRRYYPSGGIKRPIEADVHGETAMDFVDECNGRLTRSREYCTKPFEHLGVERMIRIKIENFDAPLVDSKKIAKLKKGEVK